MIDIFDRRRYILEAEDDDINTNFEEIEGEEPQEEEETPKDDNQEENPEAEEDTEDNEESDDGESEEDDDSSDEDIDNDDNEFSEENEEELDVKAAENELYKNLTDFEKITRNEELKHSFNSLYDFINEFIARLSDIKKSNINIKVIEYCESKLLAIKDLTYRHIVYNFTENTYIQNQIMYKEILFIISKISDLIEKISSENEDI